MLGDFIVPRIKAEARARGQAKTAGKLGAYNVGGCVRALWYQTHEPEFYEPRPSRSVLVLEHGQRIEDEVVDLIVGAVEGKTHRPVRCDDRACRMAKHSLEGCLDEAVELEPVGRVRCDLLIEAPVDDLFVTEPGTMVPVEIKGLSNYGFKAAQKQGELSDGYLAQAECYCRAYEAPYVVFVLYCKETSSLHEMKVWSSDSRWNHVLAQVATARGAELPDRPESAVGEGKTYEPGNLIPNFPCGYCDFKKHCWEDVGKLDLELQRGKPKWRLT